jgi:hypothetical protein
MLSFPKLKLYESAWYAFKHEDKSYDLCKIEKAKNINDAVERYNMNDAKEEEYILELADKTFKKVVVREQELNHEDDNRLENLEESRKHYDSLIRRFVIEDDLFIKMKDHYFKIYNRECLKLVRKVIKEMPKLNPIVVSVEINKENKSCIVFINNEKFQEYLKKQDKKEEDVLNDMKKSLIGHKFTNIDVVIE